MRMLGRLLACLCAALPGLGLASPSSSLEFDKLLATVCASCHATAIDGRCVAGDCDVVGRPVIRTGGRNWPLAVDYMVEAFGCAMSRHDQRVITEGLARRYPGPGYSLTWTEVLTTPHRSGWNIVSLKGWNGRLYFGTEGGGRIFSSADGVSWSEGANTGHDKVYGLTPYRGALYAGTYNPRPEIWRSEDGRAWRRVAALPAVQKGITALGVFQGRLYAGTGASRIYSSTDGVQWQDAGVLGAATSDSWPHWVRFLLEFRGSLYAGLEGGGVYRSKDGVTWVETVLPLKGRPGVRGAAVFNGALYVGTTATGEIWRSADGRRWEEILRRGMGRGYVAAMTVFNEWLYAGIDGEVLRTRDGVQWGATGEISPKTVEALAVWEADLYAGTDRPPGAQLFRTTGLTPTASYGPQGETALAGRVTGTSDDVRTGYQLPEVLEEVRVGDTSALDHRWTIRHPGGTRLRVGVRWFSPPNIDRERFVLSYSLDGVHQHDMMTVEAIEEGRAYQFFTLPALPPGELWIHVRDTDRTPGRVSLDRVSVDHLYLLAEGTLP